MTALINHDLKLSYVENKNNGLVCCVEGSISGFCFQEKEWSFQGRCREKTGTSKVQTKKLYLGCRTEDRKKYDSKSSILKTARVSLQCANLWSIAVILQTWVAYNLFHFHFISLFSLSIFSPSSLSFLFAPFFQPRPLLWEDRWTVQSPTRLFPIPVLAIECLFTAAAFLLQWKNVIQLVLQPTSAGQWDHFGLSQ